MSREHVGTATAARLLGITPSAVRRLLDRGTLGGFWVDGRRVVPRAAIAALLADPGYQARSRSRRSSQA